MVPRRRCTAVGSVSATGNLRNCMVESPTLNLHDLSIQNHASSCGGDKNTAGDGVENKRKEVASPLWELKD